MTAPPLPTFVPQDAWYSITTGGVTPSVADPVPDVSYLSPSSTPQGDVAGLVGPFDGAVIMLGGLAAIDDGGQKWLMWNATSFAQPDGQSIFNPNVSASTPGRWVPIGSPNAGPGVVQVTRTIRAGQTVTLVASAAPFVTIFVRARLANTETILTLPGATFVGQVFSIKDAQGDAATYNIVITNTVDGASGFTFYAAYQEQKFQWNGVEWSAI